jgi:hypothetical protein
MFQTVRKHLSYANVVATLAVVFAMSGGAYAVSGQGGSGSVEGMPAKASALRAQLGTPQATGAKKKKAASLRGSAGPRGAAGPAGPAGAQGPAGPAGPVGAKGETGTAGTNGTNGTNGEKGISGESVTVSEIKVGEAGCSKLGGSKFAVGGKEATACNGKNGQTGFTETLPSGKTETGTWGYITKEKEIFIPISFPIPLEGNPLKEDGCEEPEATRTKPCQVHFIAQGEKVKGCEGYVGGVPTAEPGNLCVYAGFEHGGLPYVFFDNDEGFAGGPFGGSGVILGAAGVEGVGSGAWAVTAP